MRIERKNVDQSGEEAGNTERYRWGAVRLPASAHASALAIATSVALLSGLAGCTTTTKVPDTGPDDPLNFTATNGSTDCIYDFSPGGSSADPDFTLADGVGGIMVTAARFSASFQGPPMSMRITYGNPTPIYDSGQLTLVPTADPGVTVVDSNPTSWTMTAVSVNSSGLPDGSQTPLPYGGTWSFAFSCGNPTTCCSSTISLDVVADGSP